MRILIADDHDLVRETLSAFLSMEGDISVEVANDLESACRCIADSGPFDLVLLDYGMPGMDGLKGMEIAKEANGQKPVAIMSGIAPRSTAQEAIDRGAAGYLPKTIAAKSLVNAVRFMGMGEIYVPHEYLANIEEEKHPLASKLTERELQVLEGLSNGLSNKEIARDLDLQEVTVKLHVKTLSRKLDARNRTHAAMIAKEAGLV